MLTCKCSCEEVGGGGGGGSLTEKLIRRKRVYLTEYAQA